MTPMHIDRAMGITEELNSDDTRDTAIVGLASRMNEEHLLRAAELSSRLGCDAVASVIRSIQTSSLSPLSGARLLRSLFRSRSRSQCLELLSVCGPIVEQIGGSSGVAGCLEAIDDIFSWWS